jgi:TonB-linked SusC/RagA family outer membrane protein
MLFSEKFRYIRGEIDFKPIRRMLKITFALIYFTGLHVSARSFSQVISLNVRNAPIKNVIKDIRRETGYTFFYPSGLIPKNERVTIQVRNASIDDVLKQCFYDLPFEYRIVDKTIVIREKKVITPEVVHPKKEIKVFEFPVKGKVLDENGLPLAGATIKEKGRQNATTTDGNGDFSINVTDEKSLLEISFIGYNTLEFPVSRTQDVKINLTRSKSAAEEVVIVGYGTQKKSTKTGSVDQINRAEIVNTPTTNLQNMLVGKVAGFTAIQRSGKPGAEQGAFYIRGLSTEVGSTSPLILVDDIEYDFAQFNAIDPNEVESVTVLKDAAATAIYGIKGANGAVLVTTRRGTSGRPRVTFKTQTALQFQVQPLKPLDSYESALLWNQAIANRNAYNVQNALPGGPAAVITPPKFSSADLDHYKNGTDPYGHPNIDWYNTLFKKSSLLTTNNVDVTGGGDRIKYFISLGMMHQNGGLKTFNPPSYYEKDNINNNYYFKRYNFRSNVDINATKNLTFKADISGNMQEQNEPAAVSNAFNEIMYAFGGVMPWSYAISNPDGSYGYTNNSLTGSIDGNANNIIARLALGGYDRNFVNQFNINLNGTQKLDALTKGLSLRTSLAYTNNTNLSRTMSRGAIPAFYYTPASGTTPENYLPRDPNIYRLAPLTLSGSQGAYLARTTFQTALNYSRSFKRHSTGGLLLYNRTSESFQTGVASTNMIPENFIGYTSRFNYSYADKYLLELSGAYNGTSRFEEKFGFFPAVSIGYNLAKENFFTNNIRFVNNLKFRASWGKAGSNSIGGQYAYLYFDAFGRFIAPAQVPVNSRYGYDVYNFGLTSNPSNGISEVKLGNKDISWQVEEKQNIGLDFSMFGDKLTGTVDYFNNTRSSILYVRQSVPSYYGLSPSILPPVNLGIVNNRGVDIEIRYRNNIGSLGYSVSGLYSMARNTILQWDEPPKRYPWLVRTGNSIGVEQLYIHEGFYSQSEADAARAEAISLQTNPNLKRSVAVPVGVIPIAGMLKYKDLNEDGIIDINDRAYSGNPNVPISTASMSLGLNYKGFSMNLLFQGAWNYNLRLNSNAADIFRTAFQPIHQNAWTPETASSASYPILLAPILPYSSAEQASTFWSMDTWYLRFRSFDIGYDVNPAFFKNLRASSARIFLNASNIFTWSNIRKRYQIDPEATNASSSTPYPQQRIVNAGLNVTF